MKLYEYASTNEKDCLAVFDSNVPFSFAPQERETYQGFLQRLAPPYSYFIVRDDNENIVACGGIKLEPSNHLARLRWNMVSREFQKQNFGTFLTLSRLYRICQFPDIQMATLCTSQYSYQFYEKMGFVVQHIIPDGIVAGMDEYLMELKLDEGKKKELETFAKQKSLKSNTA